MKGSARSGLSVSGFEGRAGRSEALLGQGPVGLQSLDERQIKGSGEVSWKVSGVQVPPEVLALDARSIKVHADPMMLFTSSTDTKDRAQTPEQREGDSDDAPPPELSRQEHPKVVQHQLGNTPLRNIPADYSLSSPMNFFILPDGEDKGKKLFYSDTTHGEGEAEKTLVFVHGNPESSYVYRNIIKGVLSRSKEPIRVVFMDHIGFGISDQATYEMTAMDHAHNLSLLVQALDLRDVTLVIHDWGGPIGVGAFLQQPERLSNLLITNSTIFPIPEEGKTYKKNFPFRFFPWSKTPSVVPDKMLGHFAIFAVFGDMLNPFRTVANIIREKIARTVFKEQFRSEMNVKSSKRLVLQSAVWGHGNSYVEPVTGRERDTAPFYEWIQREVGAAWGPQGANIGVRAIIGGVDALGKESVTDQWLGAFPQLNGHVHFFKRAGHFVVEEKTEVVVDEILDVAGLL